MMGYLYIILTVVLTVYGQLVLKWRISLQGAFPTQFKAQMIFLWHALLDLWVISSFAAAFVASLTWMAALTKFDLSYAYPFMSLSFILVLIISYLLFHEPLTLNKLIGILIITAGLIIAAK